MFGLGPMEIGVILLLAVLLFGNRLPKVARSVGSTFVEFKKGLSGVTEQVNDVKAEVNDARQMVNRELNGLTRTVNTELNGISAQARELSEATGGSHR